MSNFEIKFSEGEKSAFIEAIVNALNEQGYGVEILKQEDDGFGGVELKVKLEKELDAETLIGEFLYPTFVDRIIDNIDDYDVCQELDNEYEYYLDSSVEYSEDTKEATICLPFFCGIYYEDNDPLTFDF